MKTFFSYFGGKSTIIKRYPQPKYDSIVECFAGAAAYSLHNFEKNITLIEKNSLIFGIWKYLQSATVKDILSLPLLNTDDNLQKYKQLSKDEISLIGLNLVGGCARPSYKPSKFSRWNEGTRFNIANNLFKIRHWNILELDYRDFKPNDLKTTWFIDPPYEDAGCGYQKFGNKYIDYKHLAKFCATRRGEIIVCEAPSASWFNFNKTILENKEVMFHRP